MLLILTRQFHANLETIFDMHIVERSTLVNAFPYVEVDSTANLISKFAPQEWVSSTLRPTHIEKLFQILGARPVALNLTQSLEATTPTLDGEHSFLFSNNCNSQANPILEYPPQDWRCLISVLNLLSKLAKK